MGVKKYVITREQLIDAIANIEIRGLATSGPMAGKVLADSMADAILSQLERDSVKDE